ncbi:MAG: DMT family transporter, partial [Rhodospirillales bacterium]|nr:DMT family transporter [Rhodospirillales bacterium]
GMAVAARELSNTLNPFQIVFLRTSVGLVIVLAIASRMKWAQFRTHWLGFHLARNMVHYGANFLWVAGVGLIPLAQVFALEFTIPIWLAILAVLFLRERMTLGKLVVIIFGFGGVLIILRPGLVEIELGSLAVLGASVGFASANVMTKALSRTDSSFTIVFYMFAIQWPIGILGATMVWITPPWHDLPWIVLIGVTALTAHYCMAQALSLADATLVIPIDFMRLPMIVVIGMLFYDEAFSSAIVIGAVLIFGGNYFNIRAESRAQQAGH